MFNEYLASKVSPTNADKQKSNNKFFKGQPKLLLYKLK